MFCCCSLSCRLNNPGKKKYTSVTHDGLKKGLSLFPEEFAVFCCPNNAEFTRVLMLRKGFVKAKIVKGFATSGNTHLNTEKYLGVAAL